MKPSFQTLALVALASGMLASAYLIAPAPAATTPTAQQAGQQAVRPLPPVAPARPDSRIKIARAPVPLLFAKHDQYFDESTVADTKAAPALQAITEDQQARATSSDAAAKASIEMDGYRNVRALVRAPDGSWRARAMRGSTEIAVSVDANGNVSQD